MINECGKQGSEILKTKRIPCKFPAKDITIVPTDKTKRLVALDTTQYKEMIKKCTIDTGNYEERKKINQPRTEQINFNRQLNKIADKYKKKNPKLWRDLKSQTSSEPLPSPAYALPKDHKEGELKGRPIHSAVDTPATPLSKYLVDSLNPLLRHVNAHLKNNKEFIDFFERRKRQSIRIL